MLTYPYNKGEEEIAKYPRASWRYSLATKKRFILGESEMALDGDIAFNYACRILQNRFLLGERAIASDPARWERYKVIFGIKNKAKVDWKKEGF